MLARTDTSGSIFYHADGNRNITALMDQNQNIVARAEYDAFGKFLKQYLFYWSCLVVIVVRNKRVIQCG